MVEASAGTCAIVTIENPADDSVLSSRSTGQWAVVKVAAATGATFKVDHFDPGTFTNQNQAAFWNLRLLVAIDPRAEHQPLWEMPYVNLPAIALGNRLSSMRCGHYLPLQKERVSVSGSDVIDAGPGSSAHVWYHFP